MCVGLRNVSVFLCVFGCVKTQNSVCIRLLACVWLRVWQPMDVFAFYQCRTSPLIFPESSSGPADHTGGHLSPSGAQREMFDVSINLCSVCLNSHGAEARSQRSKPLTRLLHPGEFNLTPGMGTGRTGEAWRWRWNCVLESGLHRGKYSLSFSSVTIIDGTGCLFPDKWNWMFVCENGMDVCCEDSIFQVNFNDHVITSSMRRIKNENIYWARWTCASK